MSLRDQAIRAWEERKQQLTKQNVARTQQLLQEKLGVDPKKTGEIEKYVDFQGRFHTLRVIKVRGFEDCCFFSTEEGLRGIYPQAMREADLDPISEPIEHPWQLGKFCAYLASRHAHLHRFIERRTS